VVGWVGGELFGCSLVKSRRPMAQLPISGSHAQATAGYVGHAVEYRGVGGSLSRMSLSMGGGASFPSRNVRLGDVELGELMLVVVCI